VYPVIFVDAVNVKIRDGNVANRPIYLALGVTVEGTRDILGLWAGEHGDGEGAKFWARVLAELKNRGVGDVCLVVCDGLKGLPAAIDTVWPQAITQTCVVHYPDTWIMPIPRVFSLVGAVPALRISA
jgi:putative transposase